MSSTPWSFDGGRVRIDAAARLLVVNGEPAKLGGRAFDLLLALAEQRERVVTKGELLDRVWPGLFVEENNLQVQVMALRKLLGNAAIATVSGRGYRWTLAPAADAAVPPALPSIAGDALLGRDALLAQAGMLLDAGHRVLTLTGPGGAGKTRVAQRIAALRGAAQACWFVMLAPARDMPQFWTAVAAALGVQESGATPLAELVRLWLAPRAALLVLDNLEHLAGAGEAVAALRTACPQLQLLATSRTLLRVADEQVIRVPPLASVDATALFVRRAADAGRPLSRADVQDVVPAICERLDGLPLAIELAASRLRVLSPASLASRLGQRLPLLKGGPTDAPARQQTLRDTIEWSHALLPPAQQALFRRLGVFVGGWSLDAAEAIDDAAASTLDALEGLLEHNLIQRLDDVEGGPRYAMLETIREYAVERLEAGDDAAALRDRHAAFFTRQSAIAERHITSGARVAWLNRLRADLANQRAALAWTVRERRDAPAALALAATLGWPWYFFGLFQEGRQWIAEALALAGGADADRAAAMSGAARLAAYASDLASADRLSAQGVELWRRVGDRRGLALALFNQSIPFAMRGDFATSGSTLGEAQALFEALADPWGQAVATAYLGASYIMRPGSEAQARALLLEGRARFGALADDWGTTFCSYYLGMIAMRAQDFETALVLTEETLVYSRTVGDSYRIARNLHQIGEAQWHLGRKAEGLTVIAESVALNFEHRRVGDIANQMRLLMRLATDAGADGAAVRCAALAARHAAAPTTMPPDDLAAHAARVEALQARVAPNRWEANWLAGQALDADDMPALFDEIGTALR